MVVPRGTASRHADESALLDLEAALSACLHPPPSTEPPTLKKPPAVPRDTITGALLVFPRRPPTLVAAEPPRPLATTMLMANAPAPPRAAPPAWPTPPPWRPLALAETERARPSAPALPARTPRRLVRWPAAIVVLLAIAGVLVVQPQLRARTKTTAVAAAKRVARTAVSLEDRARRAIHR